MRILILGQNGQVGSALVSHCQRNNIDFVATQEARNQGFTICVKKIGAIESKDYPVLAVRPIIQFLMCKK